MLAAPIVEMVRGNPSAQLLPAVSVLAIPVGIVLLGTSDGREESRHLLPVNLIDTMSSGISALV